MVIHFDTPSRKFYFSLIALIIHEMIQKDTDGYINIRNHEKTLKLLDNAIAGPNASATVEGMWEKIRKAWRYTLPNLEEAVHFKIESREQTTPAEKGGKFLYPCSEDEKRIWASLFGFDEITNKWRYKFAFDTVGLDLGGIILSHGELEDDDAWLAFLNPLEEATRANALSIEKHLVKPSKEGIKETWPTILMIIVVALFLMIGGISILNRYLRPSISSTQEISHEIPSIAVLPFVNISGDTDQDYLCDGLTEELINNLARIKDLRVISRSSSFYFRDKNFNLRTIGNKLNVNHILEGSVRVSDENLKISAQLINVRDDSHLWAETYDRKSGDLLEIQGNLAQEIACSLRSKLGCKEEVTIPKRYTDIVEAYNLYLKGRFLWNKKSNQEAIALYKKALDIDPHYALAYAGLADAYNRLAFWWLDSREEYKQKAIETALKALEVDDELSEAYTSLGMVKLHFEWDWNGAEEAFKRAIALNPGNSNAHTYYGHLLRATDRIEEALAALTKALELDPFSRSVNQFYGMMLHVSGRVDQSIDHFRTMLELFPESPEASMLLGRILVENGKHEEGLKLLNNAIKFTNKNSPFPIAFLGYAYGISGRKNEAQDLLNEAVERWEKGGFPAGFIALITMGLGDKEETFKWLQIAFDQRRSSNFALRTIPMYKPLHSDPRWAELMRNMGHEGY